MLRLRPQHSITGGRRQSHRKRQAAIPPLPAKGRNLRAAKRMIETVETNAAPGAIGPYSQAIKINNMMLYTSGQLPVDPETGEMPAGAEKQAEQSLKNLKAVVEAAGASMANVVKTTVFIKHMDDFARINEVYAKYFDKPYPARSCVEVARLPKDALVEIECVAVIG